MESFHNIKINTRCDVTLSQGNMPKIEIVNDEAMRGWLDYEIKNGELILFTKPEHYGFLLMHDHYPKVNITINVLNGIEVLDSAFVSSAGVLQLPKLGLIVKSGHVKLDINTALLDLTILKRANVKLNGVSIISNVLIHGLGFYDGENLDVSEGNICLNKDAKALISISDLFELRMYGRSRLEFTGCPKITLINMDDGCSISNKMTESISNGSI
ncbi:GIN domain-containing protein [Sphingobacterium sp. UDSM-2020]|uniref:GIN domain-containing protein n=1 Tax=Sphingobacterium sp. UDSM-2020 TaxID=2795738 RepID=UPI001935158E|nr:DUF2807 domain-containing protein [Sphingobacterium sp. UDSM-2020]QQD13374.1 DUF2807 domain-containing protein [Sphingobacterium sp. UDSM-2020]